MLSSLANVAQRLPLLTAAAADDAASTHTDDVIDRDSNMGVLAFCVDTQALLLQKHFAALEKSVAFLRDIVREFPDVLRRMRGFVSAFVDLLDCIAPDEASASGTQTLYTQLEWMENVLAMYERELRRKRLLVADVEYHDASRIGRMHAHWSARGVQSCVDHRYGTCVRIERRDAFATDACVWCCLDDSASDAGAAASAPTPTDRHEQQQFVYRSSSQDEEEEAAVDRTIEEMAQDVYDDQWSQRHRGHTRGTNAGGLAASHARERSALDERNAADRARAVLGVLVREEAHEQVLFVPVHSVPYKHSVTVHTPESSHRDNVRNAISKEAPGHDRVADAADRIAQEHLAPDGPEEPAHVRRVAHVAVHAVRHEHVLLALLVLDAVRKVRRRGRHRRDAQRLADEHDRDAAHEHARVELPARDEVELDPELEHADEQCDVVLAAVVEQER